MTDTLVPLTLHISVETYYPRILFLNIWITTIPNNTLDDPECMIKTDKGSPVFILIILKPDQNEL